MTRPVLKESKQTTTMLSAAASARDDRRCCIICHTPESQKEMVEYFPAVAKEAGFKYRQKGNLFHARRGNGNVEFLLESEMEKKHGKKKTVVEIKGILEDHVKGRLRNFQRT